MATMKKGRFSKDDINYIEENIDIGLNRIATELNRNPDSVLDFIKKKVAKKVIQQQDEDLDPIMEAFAESPKKSNT